MPTLVGPDGLVPRQENWKVRLETSFFNLIFFEVSFLTKFYNGKDWTRPDICVQDDV